jgi:hypothetical protein
MCGQRLRRRGPTVLGEEHRPGARLLPIERALNERLHGTTTTGRRGRHFTPPPWAEEYRASVRQATARMEAAAREMAGQSSGGGVATLTAPPGYFDDAEVLTREPVVPETPALDIESYLSSFEPHDVLVDNVETTIHEHESVAPERDVDAAPLETMSFARVPADDVPLYEVETGPLDPEVQALVDDLYRKARAEIVGSFDGLEPEYPADAHLDEQSTQVADEPPAPPRRRGWVPAVLADRRRHDGTTNGKRPNGNGWRRLD